MNPAEHSARQDAERRGVVVGTPEDDIESRLLAETDGEDDGGVGAWLWGAVDPV